MDIQVPQYVSKAQPGPGDLHAEVLELGARVERLTQMLTPTQPALAPELTPMHLRLMIKARRTREIMFGADLIADPAWDMLLEANVADLMQTRLSVTALCLGAAVPATTALRWLNKLEVQGWLQRMDDPLDARRTWIELTPQASARMYQYLSTLRPDVLPI